MIGPFLQQLVIASIMVGLTVIVHFAGLSVLLAMIRRRLHEFARTGDRSHILVR